MASNPVARLATVLSRQKTAQEAMSLLSERRREFDSDLAMQVSAISMSGMRERMEEGLQGIFTRPTNKQAAEEAIIGSGWHAGQYATTRVACGFPPPLVLEESDYPGGCFAKSRRAAFRANSRNRPGPLGLPGQGRGLNAILGATVQPSMLGTDEFQTNRDLAFCVRLALAENARVRSNAKVVSVKDRGPKGTRFRYALKLERGGTVFTNRVIDARGLGECRRPEGVNFDGEHLMDFNQFLKRLEQPFPFRGWNRVAVVGQGDGANCVIEALLGIGPSQRSLTQLDFVPSIDWYGPELARTKKAWADTTRCRYALIGTYLPRFDDNNLFTIENGNYTSVDSEVRTSRVETIRAKGTVRPGLGGCFVNGQFYDVVITATGYEQPKEFFDPDTDYVRPDGETSTCALKQYAQEYYKIGPIARLPFDNDPASVIRFPQNRVAIFRLTGRTARLALTLGKP